MAYWSNGSVVLKKLELPPENDFEKEVDKIVLYAKENGIKEKDIGDAIKTYRAEKRGN